MPGAHAVVLFLTVLETVVVVLDNAYVMFYHVNVSEDQHLMRHLPRSNSVLEMAVV